MRFVSELFCWWNNSFSFLCCVVWVKRTGFGNSITWIFSFCRRGQAQEIWVKNMLGEQVFSSLRLEKLIWAMSKSWLRSASSLAPFYLKLIKPTEIVCCIWFHAGITGNGKDRINHISMNSVVFQKSCFLSISMHRATCKAHGAQAVGALE